MSIYSIYRVVNIKNGKVYIGFDSCWPNRKNRHLKDSRTEKSTAYNDIFHKAIRKYGKESFDWQVIYQSLDSEHCLKKMESYFIQEYNSYVNYINSNGYNMTLGGEGVLGLKKSKDSKLKTSISCGKIFKVWHKNGQLIEDKHIKNFCIKNNLNYGNFKRMIDGQRFVYGDYYPYDGEKSFKEVLNKYQEKIKKSMQIMGEKHSKTYTLMSPENKLITFTNLAKFARDNNLNPQSLKQVAMGRLKSNKGWTLS
jgi:group I intron endonuclease